MLAGLLLLVSRVNAQEIIYLHSSSCYRQSRDPVIVVVSLEGIIIRNITESQIIYLLTRVMCLETITIV